MGRKLEWTNVQTKAFLSKVCTDKVRLLFISIWAVVSLTLLKNEGGKTLVGGSYGFIWAMIFFKHETRVQNY